MRNRKMLLLLSLVIAPCILSARIYTHKERSILFGDKAPELKRIEKAIAKHVEEAFKSKSDFTTFLKDKTAMKASDKSFIDGCYTVKAGVEKFGIDNASDRLVLDYIRVAAAEYSAKKSKDRHHALNDLVKASVRDDVKMLMQLTPKERAIEFENAKWSYAQKSWLYLVALRLGAVDEKAFEEDGYYVKEFLGKKYAVNMNAWDGSTPFDVTEVPAKKHLLLSHIATTIGSEMSRSAPAALIIGKTGKWKSRVVQVYNIIKDGVPRITARAGEHRQYGKELFHSLDELVKAKEKVESKAIYEECMKKLFSTLEGNIDPTTGDPAPFSRMVYNYTGRWATRWSGSRKADYEKWCREVGVTVVEGPNFP